MPNSRRAARASLAGVGYTPASRRSFLLSTGLVSMSVASLTACDTLSLDPGGDDDGGADSGPKGNEAPMLARMVEAGDLPPVEERLPDSPAQVDPIERPGDYGGEWRSVLFGSTEGAWLNRTLGYEYLARWYLEEPDGLPEAIPNVAENFEFNDEGTEYVITLRAGMKWSDGTPFTADDIVFAQEINETEELFPVPPWAGTAEKVDDLTVRFVFTEPEGLFIQKQAGPGGVGLVSRPKHYLSTFLPEYNDELDQLVEEEGFDDWVDLYHHKADVYQNMELPTLRAWNPVNEYGESGRLRFERNPYYWKVDSDGSQLPYIDRVTFDILSDPEVAVVRASQGQIDFMERTIVSLRNKPVLADAREAGDYRFFDRIAALENYTIISLNLTHEDPVLREIFNELDFRIGLSYAINRQEIIDTVFAGQGEPWQAAPRRESPYFDEEFAKQYTEHDVDLANEHLDRVYPERNGDGRRLGPDGNPIRFTIEFTTGFAPEWADSLEMVRDYWLEVGVEVSLQPIDRSLYHERRDANQHDATVWEGAAGLRDDVLLEARWYLPTGLDSNFATPWGRWYSSQGSDSLAMEPPEDVQQQMELFRSRNETTDPDEQDAIMQEVLAIAKEKFYCIGINLFPPSYGIATNRFRNVPDPMLASWIYQPPGNTHPEQYFIRADQQ